MTKDELTELINKAHLDGNAAIDVADNLHMMLDFRSNGVVVTLSNGSDIMTTTVEFREGRKRSDVIRYAIQRAARRVVA